MIPTDNAARLDAIAHPKVGDTVIVREFEAKVALVVYDGRLVLDDGTRDERTCIRPEHAEVAGEVGAVADDRAGGDRLDPVRVLHA